MVRRAILILMLFSAAFIGAAVGGAIGFQRGAASPCADEEQFEIHPLEPK
jgi:hypothetical protein